MRDNSKWGFPTFRAALRTRKSFQIALLLVISLVFRIGLALTLWKLDGRTGFVASDSSEYIMAARSLLHGSFSSAAGPEVFLTPGYPLILMSAVFTKHLEIFALLENFLLASFSVWLVWKLTLRVFKDSNAALWAALLFCFEPLQMEGSELVMTETLFCALVLVCVWFFVCFLDLPSYKNLLCAALALILAIYTRPVAMFLGIWLAPLLLFLPGTLSQRRRVVRAVVFPVTVAIALLPWIIRNERVAQYHGFSAVSDDNLYFCYATAIEAKVQNKSFLQGVADRGGYDDNVYFQLHPDQRNWTRGDIFNFQRKDGLKTISQHPWWFLYVQIKGWLSVTLNPTAAEVMMNIGLYPRNTALLHAELDKELLKGILLIISRYPETVVIVLVMELQLLIYYFLAIIGLRRLPRSFRLLFLSVALYFILVSGGPIAVSRYRTPVMPLVCIGAGIAMAKLQDNGWKIKGSRKSSELLA